MNTSGNSWFSGLGIEDTFCSSDQYDIMEFFDEQYLSSSANFGVGEEFILQNSHQSPDSNSSCTISTMINSIPTATTNSTNSTLSPSPPNNIEQNLVPVIPNSVSSLMEAQTVAAERPAKLLKRTNNTPIILTFGNPVSVPEVINPQQTSKSHELHQQDDDALSAEVLMTSRNSFTSLDEASKSAAAAAVQSKSTAKTRKRVRPESQTYDHIIAERKRREQLSQRFMALSAIVPGLKKLDKTSVLGDTITYLKQLKERVKTLEEQATKQRVESVVLVKKSQLLVDDQIHEVGNNNGSKDTRDFNVDDDEQPLIQAEIEAKVCDKKVLIRVHCENHKGVLVRLISEVENLNLAITNTSVAMFGSLALDITIIAEMEQEFNITTKELVRSLQSALHRVGLQDDRMN